MYWAEIIDNELQFRFMMDGGKYLAYMNNVNIRESLLKNVSLFMMKNGLKDDVKTKNDLAASF
jgi:hypothetical protein